LSVGTALGVGSFAEVEAVARLVETTFSVCFAGWDASGIDTFFVLAAVCVADTAWLLASTLVAEHAVFAIGVSVALCVGVNAVAVDAEFTFCAVSRCSAFCLWLFTFSGDALIGFADLSFAAGSVVFAARRRHIFAESVDAGFTIEALGVGGALRDKLDAASDV
jgi:hypothetical protein